MCVAAPVLALILAVMPVHAEPADTPRALWQTLGACARRAPVAPGAAGSEITVLLTLRRDGTLQSKPRITHTRLIGDADRERASVAATLSAIVGGFPTAIADGPGGAVAGQPIRFGITSKSRGA